MTKVYGKEGNKENKSTQHKYFKTQTQEDYASFTKQINFCSKHCKKEKAKYYESLRTKNATGNTKFWKTAPSLFLR